MLRQRRVTTESKGHNLAKHQRTEPPGRPAQPAPPHVPHCASQQMSSFPTPIKPLLQTISVGSSRGEWKEKKSKLLRRDNYKCPVCHEYIREDKVEIHHIKQNLAEMTQYLTMLYCMRSFTY